MLCLVTSCDDCDDCKDLQTKSVVFEDAMGNNLLFGNNAIYDPEAVTVTGGDESWPVFIDSSAGAVEFSLEEGVFEYIINLNENTSDTLRFDLDERDSERCCGTQTFSTSTQVNGMVVDNTDTITIVK